ncbi:hypothetical protein [Haloplanus halophilus]|nr:hypothetical protein [Haloplanus sp. GDY1]
MTGPRRRRARLWAGLYVGVFDVGREDVDDEGTASDRNGERE